MSDFRKLSDTMLASPQIAPADVAAARAQGVTMIINNRPDGESDDQPSGAEIEAAARNAGMEYVAIPITQSGFSQPQVDAMAEALARAEGPVLGYCRSGTRSTLLWSLAQARQGMDPDDIAAAAEAAGYDVAPVRMMIDMLAAEAKG
ncbi:TIGR01244 family sulfur transferase [Parerythrobacter aestuarii]|uniref:TIGR01244 family sulfur transferase n=1 Tax=Parerythrobacter aestuarii TaxID=3020909 RepID=UPI0024DE8DC6|nr:TIGR01244 family sulfur transferase [Parerythrobacter aestuarii]